jgi:hypothetical protein
MMTKEEVFRVENVEIVRPLGDSPEQGWCRYVVASEHSRVVGRFRGTLKQTRRNAERLVRGLNERLQTGKVPWTPRATSRKTRKVARATH